eukprot:12262400-Alexandrium_andersonii.AAC.1
MLMLHQQHSPNNACARGSHMFSKEWASFPGFSPGGRLVGPGGRLVAARWPPPLAWFLGFSPGGRLAGA